MVGKGFENLIKRRLDSTDLWFDFSCGPFQCPKSDNSSVCSDLLNNDYKFYLSFENSNCLDYMTEKFWYNGLM